MKALAGWSGTRPAPERMKQYRDFYFKKAKQDNYPARSVYKLLAGARRTSSCDRAKRCSIPGACPVLDSCTRPNGRRVRTGPWHRSEHAGHGLPRACRLPTEDIFARSPEFLAHYRALAPFDRVMSDMVSRPRGRNSPIRPAHPTGGRSLRGGPGMAGGWRNSSSPRFEGPDVQPFVQSLRGRFAKVSMFKPKSSRSERRNAILGSRFVAASGSRHRLWRCCAWQDIVTGSANIPAPQGRQDLKRGKCSSPRRSSWRPRAARRPGHERLPARPSTCQGRQSAQG